MMVATSLQEVRKENSGVEALGRKLAEEVDAHIQRYSTVHVLPFHGVPRFYFSVIFSFFSPVSEKSRSGGRKK